MIHDADLIARLESALQPAELSAAIKRLRRVQEAWAALHDSDFLDYVLEHPGEINWAPAAIADCSLLFKPPESVQSGSSSPAPDSPANAVARLSELARNAHALAKQVNKSVESAVENFRAKPMSWSNALSCAWPHLKKPASLLENMLAVLDGEMARLVATVLLANHAVPAAAETLQDYFPQFSPYLITLSRQGEQELATQLAENNMDLASDEDPWKVDSDKVATSFAQAARGNYDHAHALLTSAWDDALESTARVADGLAEIARAEGNPAVELEARRHAFEKGFSPTRRAALARSLVENNKDYEAYQLAAQPERVEERIAYGMAALQQGLAAEAQTALIQAKQEALQLECKDSEWLTWLSEGLRACGAITEAIETKTYLTSLIPHQSGIELELADLWEQAGDPSKAAMHARLALALAPGSISARRQLAHALRLNGEAEKALPYFKQVVQEDESAVEEYCLSALETGRAEMAVEISTSLIERQPESAQAQTFLARAYQLKGETDLARSAISKSIELNANDVEPLLVLADIQSTTDEMDAAGETLLQAIQVAPDDGRAHYARSQWLTQQGRLHEACEHSAQAIKLEPQATSWIVDHAELLAKTGNEKQARTYLEEAMRQQPKNWRVRVALARSWEKTGEVEKAVALLEEPPAEINDETRIHAGRILIKFGLNADPGCIQKGLSLIEAAQQSPDFKPESLFWLGRAKEALGYFPQAFEHFESYLTEIESGQGHNALEAVLAYARVAIALKKPDLAIAFLQANREKYPASLDLLKILGDAYLSNGEGAQAFNIAQEAVSLNPISIDALRMLSHTAEATGDIHTAIDAEQDLLAQQPQRSDGWSRLALLYTAIKDEDTARAHMAKAIQISRHDPDHLQKFAAQSGQMGWTRTQLRLLKQAAKLIPGQVALQRSVAELAEDAGDFDTAQQAWLRCVDQIPHDVDLIKRAASALSKSGQTKNAIEFWEQALEQEPENTEVLLSLGQAYLNEGNPQASLGYFEQILDLDVSDPEVQVEIARVLLQYGAPEKGKHIIDRTLKQAPEHLGAHLARVEALLQSGEAELAYQAAEVAIALAPPDTYTIGLAALSAVMVGDLDSATTGLDEALHETHLPSQAAHPLMLVSAALGEWRVYNTLLHAFTESGVSTAVSERQALRMLLRARDLEWLHSKAFNIRKNIPDGALIEKRLQTHLEALGKYFGDEKALNNVEVMLRWNEMMETPSTEIGSEIVPLSQDERQEYTQAAVIGLLNSNRPAKALGLLEQNPPTGLYRGSHALLTGLAALKLAQFPRAKDAAHIATRYSETRACGAYLQAEISLAELDNEAAITALNAALAIWPDEADWHTKLAQIYLQTDRKEAALPHLQQAVELDPHNSENLISLARAYRTAGEWTQAEAIYARCLQDSPGSAQMWKEAGEVALTIGHASQAESWFERACSLAPSDAVCLMGSARAALLMGEPKLAAERAQSAYKLAPNEPQVLSGFAEILALQGKTDKAIQAYDRALKISAGDPQVQLARSRLLMKNEQYTDAINDIQTVLKTDSDDPAAWALLAEAHEGADQLDQALTAINTAINLSPRAGSYRLTQGRIYRKSGQLDQALAVLREFEVAEPTDPNLPGELGLVYEARRETDAALDAYLRAVAINTHDIRSSMRAGLILKGLKSYEHAAEMFERVVMARPKDADALHQLAAVRALQIVHGGIEKQVVAS